MKLNLPNKLTVLRLIMVPIFVAVMMASNALWTEIVGLALFIIASLTDMLDGKIARKYNLITDFGKFLDPLADKFMVIGAMLVILYKAMSRPIPNKLFCILFFVGVFVVIFRELAVTSMRLVVSGSSGIVIAANNLGKIKTCTQIACVILCFAESIFYYHLQVPQFLTDWLPLSLISTVLMAFFTLWSGINYIKSYWQFLDPQK